MAANAEAIFEKAGAVLKGHFLLTSGLHSPIYWEKFRVLQFPGYTERLCRMIAGHFQKDNIQVVAGPTVGGIILAHEVGRQMGVRSIYAEKEEGGSDRTFRRGLTLSPGERVLIVDDVLTTGKSVREVMAAVARSKGQLAGVGVLVDRSEKDPQFGVPLFSCLRSGTVTYTPQDCPLCAAGVPLVKPGSSQQPLT
ncbi:MAG: orotate phosphoribosyltransferase [Chloroflexota bacterium]